MAWKDTTKIVGVLPLIAGVRTDGNLKLENGVLTDSIDLRVSTTVRVTAGGATLRNRGASAALLDEVLIDEGGTERVLARGNVLRVLSQANARSPLPNTRIPTQADGTVAVGVYPISETVRVFFAWPESANPSETAWTERKTMSTNRVVVRQVRDAVAALLTLNAGAATVDPVMVDIVQNYASEGNAPLFIPTIRDTIVPVNGQLAQFPEYIRTPNKIRAIVLSQEVVKSDGTVAEVSDILTHYTLRGQRQFPIGPERLPYADLSARMAYEFGGDLSYPGHAVLAFTKQGRLSKLLEPSTDINMRHEFWAAPSANAGQSQIRITYVELEEIPGVTVPASARPF